jgi:hypothetical protein
MVEVDQLDDVGRALDRVMKTEHRLSSTLGRHTNDKMVSFYVRRTSDARPAQASHGLLGALGVAAPR